MSSQTPAIQTSGLRKTFNDKVAVQDLTLTVERGEVFGFLGPNGAGKTTSVKMLLNLITPDAGQGLLFGKPLTDPEARAKVGFLPEHFRFHDWLQAREFLALHADLYYIPRPQANKRIDELLELVGLTEHAGKRLSNFSKGMLQRIGLAQALLNHPELVFLDEPTSGLDPVGRRLVRDIIRQLSRDGAAVFLNSHFLSEVEITCHRVAFIKHGEIIRSGPMQSLVQGETHVQVRARRWHSTAVEGLARWARDIRLDGEELVFAIDDEEHLPAIHRFLVEQGMDVFDFHPQRLSLEELFIQIVGEDGGL